MQGPSTTQVGVSLALEAHRRGLVDDGRLQAILDYYGRGSGAPGSGVDPPRVVLARLGGLAEHEVTLVLEASRGLPGPTAAKELGRPFGPRLTLFERLGEGGMGTVFRAHDRVLKRSVAVKVLKLDSSHDAAQRALRLRRFEREAQLMARLRHPTIVSVWDAGVSDEGDPYLVMELVAGRSLSDLIREQGRLEVAKVVAWGRALAEGLAACHAAGIVHRDLKPANVLIDARGQARLTDFGVAGDREAVTRLTAEHQAVGTLTYMSKEQVSGEECDGRTDLHALGATLHEALTGERVFSGPYPELVLKILKEPAPSARASRPEVPPALDDVLLRCLEKERAARWSSADELAAALLAVERGEAPASAPGVEPAPAPLAARRPRRGRGSPWPTVGLALGAALVGGLGVAWALRASPPATPGPAPSKPPVAPAAAVTSPSPSPGTAAGPGAPARERSRVVALGGDLVNQRDGSVLQLIQPGRFDMGSDQEPDERPLRSVDVPRGYYIGRYELTWGQLRRWLEETGEPPPPAEYCHLVGVVTPVRDEEPAVMTWAQAAAYCAWADLRLPSEVEWEFAARGTRSRVWPWGDGFPRGFRRVANVMDATLLRAMTPEEREASLQHLPFEYDDGATGPWVGGSAPLGVSPNGCHDMAGNVSEWTSAAAGRGHVARGGRWTDSYYSARCSSRPDMPDGTLLGLRVARDAD